MSFRPRPYQIAAVASTMRALGKHRSTLIVMPTGMGKTVTFAHIIKKVAESGPGRVLVMAHRRELIDQSAATIERMTGIDCAIDMAAEKADDDEGMFVRKARVVVGSVATLVSKRADGTRRCEKFDPAEFRCVIIDEAHHATAQSYRKVLNHFKNGNPKLRIIGVTATPDRADKIGLKTVFESVAFNMTVQDAVGGGWLVPVRQRIVELVDVDFSGISTRAGDFAPGELSAICSEEKAVIGMVDETRRHAGNRKAIVFAVDVNHAKKVAEVFNRYEFNSARVVTGNTPTHERIDIIEAFAKGKFRYLVNVGVATEGFDDPGVSAVVLMRPTKSRALYAQMVGRGLRPATDIASELGRLPDDEARREMITKSSKTHAMIIDFKGNAGKHKLVHMADILGGKKPPEVLERASKIIEESAVDMDVAEAIDQAEAQVLKEKAAEEAERRAAIRGKAQARVREVNPFDILSTKPPLDGNIDYTRPPSEKMISMLERAGVPTDGLSFDEAKVLIKNLMKKRELNLCTFKQAKLLQRTGGFTPSQTSRMSFSRASDLITELANNGWKRPEHWDQKHLTPQ